jgi:7-carboxy-7-deazaguanine synthase
MKICEIFSSIQGESSYAGYPCVFIRATGCNLRCSYCDTRYAYDEGNDIGIAEICDTVESLGIEMVEITGGEPLIQEESCILMRELADRGYRVLLETNGSIDLAGIDSRVSIILDIKTPSSAMSDRMLMTNLELVKKKDDVKFVLSDRADYDWSRKIMEKYSLPEKTNVLLSPVFKVLDPAELARWMIRDRINAKLNLQLHKYIFEPDRRGV